MDRLLAIAVWTLLGQGDVGPSMGPNVDVDVVAALVTPNGVVLKSAHGVDVGVPGTRGSRAVAFDRTNKTLYVAGPHAIRQMSFEGQEIALLSDGWEMIDGISVSPDGRSIAFGGYTRSGKWAIYTLTGRNANPEFVAKGAFPAWTHDGRTILFENYTDASAQIYRFDPDTRAVSRVSYDDLGEIQSAVSIAVSADGRYRSFATQGGLWLKDTTSDETQQLTDGSYYDGHPAFSASGSALWFVRKRRDPKLGRVDPRVYRMDLGSGRIMLMHSGDASSVALPHSSGC